MNKTPRRTILDISLWKPGDIAYAVTHHTPRPVDVPESDMWMVDGTVHPKVAYERGILENSLGKQTALPKMHAIEFDFVVTLLQSALIVSEFKIVSVERCTYTGECQYVDGSGNNMPESCLFSTWKAADQERRRILDIIRKWACDEPIY